MSDINPIVLIDRNPLSRDYFGRALWMVTGAKIVVTFTNVNEWREATRRFRSPILLIVSLCGTSSCDLEKIVGTLRDIDQSVPIAVLSDDEDPISVLQALDLGVNGYIPSSFGIDVAMEAMRLVIAGGRFVPATALLSYRQWSSSALRNGQCRSVLLTARQEEVVLALRRGNSNKLIAGELAIGEGTVKVHIRNIMKKLKAKNRDELVFMTKDIVTKKLLRSNSVF